MYTINIEENKVTFDDLLTEACNSAGLPNVARLLLPSALSEQTKKVAMKLTPEEFGRVLKTAIDEIEHGSVESVDSLVRKLI